LPVPFCDDDHRRGAKNPVTLITAFGSGSGDIRAAIRRGLSLRTYQTNVKR